MGNPAGVKRDFEALEKRRFQAMKLLDQGLNQSEVARRLKVVRQTVSRWVEQRRQHGRAGLVQAGRAGRKPRLSQAQKQRLIQLLVQGPQALGYETPLWSCPRVAALIEEEFGVSYHEGHVWKLLVSLGWSCQRPAGRALQRNEEEIRQWKQHRWPAIKKKPARKGARLSSSTKVV
jgi:transposase